MVVVWGYGLMVWHKLNLTLSLIENKEWVIFFPSRTGIFILVNPPFFVHFIKALTKREVVFCS